MLSVVLLSVKYQPKRRRQTQTTHGDDTWRRHMQMASADDKCRRHMQMTNADEKRRRQTQPTIADDKRRRQIQTTYQTTNQSPPFVIQCGSRVEDRHKLHCARR